MYLVFCSIGVRPWMSLRALSLWRFRSSDGFSRPLLWAYGGQSVGIIVGTHVRLRTLGHVCCVWLQSWVSGALMFMREFDKVLMEGWSVTYMCDSPQAEAENLLLRVNDSIILEVFVLDFGGKVGGGGGQQIPSVLTSQVLCCVASRLCDSFCSRRCNHLWKEMRQDGSRKEFPSILPA